MTDTRIILFDGADGDPETGEGWLPSVSLEHEGTELFVIVEEEIGGMAEGVPAEAFEAIRRRLS